MVRGSRLIAVVLLAAAAARGQERDPRARQQQDAGTAPTPLSNEDAKLIKELALIERLELLRNLELFEQEKESKPRPQQQEGR